MFVKTICECQKTYYARAKGLIKCKIENGKLKINVGQTVCNVKKHIMPERSIATVRPYRLYTAFIV